jgi:hypothetical protein
MKVSGQLLATAALPPGVSLPGTHWTECCVGPRAGLDGVEKRIISCPCTESKPDSSAVQQVAPRYIG